MAFRITTHKNRGVLVLKLSGRLTYGEAAEDLRDTVRELFDEGGRAFVLDLSNVSYMDSAGLGQVVATYASARKKHGQVVLLTPSRRSEHLLHIAKLHTVFDIFEDEAAAIEAVIAEVAAPA